MLNPKKDKKHIALLDKPDSAVRKEALELNAYPREHSYTEQTTYA